MAGNLVDHNMSGELTGEVTSSAGPVKLADLQRILRNIQTPAEAFQDPDAGLGLGDILKPDLLKPLVESLSLEQRLASYLPEGSWTPQEIMDLLQSPPFRQQVDSFSHITSPCSLSWKPWRTLLKDLRNPAENPIRVWIAATMPWTKADENRTNLDDIRKIAHLIGKCKSDYG